MHNKPTNPPDQKSGSVIFRRFRRVRGSDKVLDAHDYGLDAWPIKIVPATKRKTPKKRH